MTYRYYNYDGVICRIDMCGILEYYTGQNWQEINIIYAELVMKNYPRISESEVFLELL